MGMVEPVAKPEVSKWGGGLRGRVREGVYPVPLGVRGLWPRKIFQIADARRRVLAHFSDKNQYIDACIYACRLWQSSKPF
jgi:hypothetical protein